MKKLLIGFSFAFVASAILLTSCKKDEEQPTTGKLEGYVKDVETNTAVSEVKILVFDANTNSPTGESYYTNGDGFYQIETLPGTFYLKLSKLGYESIPGKNMSPLPLTVERGLSTSADFELTPSTVVDGSIVNGVVKSGDEGTGGVLVVAEDGTNSYSTVSDAQGNYSIYNIPAGTYTIKGWLAGFNSSSEAINVEASSELNDINLELTSDANSMVSGAISFLATENSDVDVALVHPVTKETIPGLTTRTSQGIYTMQNVPNGTYIGRASFANDSLVMDPDWIVKMGEPIVTINDADVELDFSVTGAVSVINPTNPASSTQPVEVSLDTLNFSWEPYPSSSDYVIEVINTSGVVIWGGFSNNWTEKNVEIPSSTTTVEYNFDNSASAPLEPGKTYRWRIYASKIDLRSDTGWNLISVSEDQMGLIKIVE